MLVYYMARINETTVMQQIQVPQLITVCAYKRL